MAGSLAEEISVREAMDHAGTVHVGRFQLVRSGPTVGGCIPAGHREPLGALDAGETDVYVNHELGVVLHKIPDE